MTRNIQEEQAECDDEVSDDDLADLLYIPEAPTDYENSEQATIDQSIKSHTEETRYLVFWFCLIPKFCHCLKYLTYATVKRSGLKGKS